MRRLPATEPNPEHKALVAALQRRKARLSDVDKGRLVAAAVDAAIGPLSAERVRWLRETAIALGMDLQPIAGRVLDVGPMPLRPPGR